MKNIKWFFFDIGSTLADESKVLEDMYQKIAESSEKSEEYIYKRVVEFYKQNKRGEVEVAKMLGVHKPKSDLKFETLYKDAEECLNELSKKYKIGIIANQEPGTAQRLELYGIGKYIDSIVASAEEGLKKPDSKIFEIALKKANCSPTQAVMVGDLIYYDILPAKKVGMKTIWIKQGMGRYWTPNNSNEKPDYEVDSLLDILKLI